MKHWPLISWARKVYIIGLVLAIAFIIPTIWFPLQLGKISVFAVCALVAGILFFAGGGTGGIFGKRGLVAAAFVGLLPLVYGVSYMFSIDRSVGLLGYTVEADTAIFALICFCAFLLASVLFRRVSSLQTLFISICSAASAAVVFQFVVVLFGTHLVPFAVFSDASVNAVGKWNDLGLLAGAALACVAVWVEYGNLSLRRKVLAAFLVGLFAVFLALVQFSVIWVLLAAFFVALGLWSFFVHSKKIDRVSMDRRQWLKVFPWFPIAGVAVSVFFILFGATVQGGLTRVLPVSSLEVRPSLSSTLDIVRAAHGTSVKQFLVGTGPGTFSENWFLYKPMQVNQSQFWNLDFNVGYSTVSTMLGTVGVLGVLALLIPLVLLLIGLVRVLRSHEVFSASEKAVAVSAVFVSVYLWASMFLYVPSQNILLLAFALSGAAFGFCMKGGDIPAAEEEKSPRTRPMYVAFQAAAAVCLVLLVLASGLVVRRFVAETYTNKGLYALQQNDIAGAIQYSAHASNIEKTGDTLQIGVLAGTANLQQIANSTSKPSAELQQQFATQAQITIQQAQQAIIHNPNDYRAYLSLGRLYDLLASLGVQGGYESAKQAYDFAAQHNPTDPEIPLAIARLESVQKNTPALTAALKQALTLKPDYTDAILFVVQLDIANKDLPSAIVAARAAVSSAPGIPSIWFELGLLYYSTNDMKNAAAALGQAVKLQPNYANAKYFLGLADASLGLTPDAIQQFKDLQVTNPDNSEVKLILSNLEAGKAPFDGATPPVTTTPQNRATAPVSQ